MRKLASGLAVFAVFAAIGFFSVRPSSVQSLDLSSSDGTGASSFNDVRAAIERMDLDLDDSRVFNSSTATKYLNALADRAYLLTGSDFSPRGEVETREFVATADSIVQKIFSLRLKLSEKLLDFENVGPSTSQSLNETVTAFRRAHLYLRYAEDYTIEWLHRLSPLKNSRTFFDGQGPLSLANPRHLEGTGKFRFRAGDVLLVRGASFFSATIARIGDMPTNMSHIAMIAERPDGQLYVVEALLEKNMVSYPLDTYLALEPLPRVALYRFRDPNLARRAGQELWTLYNENLSKPVPFDVFMNPNDHSKVYCAELMAMAYERASAGAVRIPRYQTEFSRVAKTDFAKQIGLTAARSFAPADIDVDTRFSLVGEHRDLEMLAESRRFDVVLSRLFEKFQQGFVYRSDASAGLEATFAMFGRTFGLLKGQVPEGVNLEMLSSLLRHRNFVATIMKDFAVAEDKAVRENGRPLAYRELEVLFDRVCGGTCLDSRAVQMGFSSGKTCEGLFKATL